MKARKLTKDEHDALLDEKVLFRTLFVIIVMTIVVCTISGILAMLRGNIEYAMMHIFIIVIASIGALMLINRHHEIKPVKIKIHQ